MNRPKQYHCDICGANYYPKQCSLDIVKDFPEHSFWIEYDCPNYKDHLKIIRQKEIAKIPIETKQKLIDLMHQGKKLGEACKIVGISLDYAAQIITDNIVTHSYLKTKVE